MSTGHSGKAARKSRVESAMREELAQLMRTAIKDPSLDAVGLITYDQQVVDLLPSGITQS